MAREVMRGLIEQIKTQAATRGVAPHADRPSQERPHHPAIRAEMASSTESAGALARRFGVSVATASKWKKRPSAHDLSHTAHHLQTTLTPAQERVAVELRRHWVDLLEGSDACFAPVLTPVESMAHPHMAARGVYSEHDGVLQAAPAPRFSGTPAAATIADVPGRGQHSAEVLREAGLSEDEIALLVVAG